MKNIVVPLCLGALRSTCWPTIPCPCAQTIPSRGHEARARPGRSPRTRSLQRSREGPGTCSVRRQGAAAIRRSRRQTRASPGRYAATSLRETQHWSGILRWLFFILVKRRFSREASPERRSSSMSFKRPKSCGFFGKLWSSITSISMEKYLQRER